MVTYERQWVVHDPRIRSQIKTTFSQLPPPTPSRATPTGRGARPREGPTTPWPRPASPARSSYGVAAAAPTPPPPPPRCPRDPRGPRSAACCRCDASGTAEQRNGAAAGRKAQGTRHKVVHSGQHNARSTPHGVEARGAKRKARSTRKAHRRGLRVVTSVLCCEARGL
jgi:hypothetical protein